VLTAEKLRLVGAAADEDKYVVCNAYDADARSLISRTLLARDPHRVIEGIVLAAHTVGAREAYIFMRGAHEESAHAIRAALREAADQHLIGRDILGSRFECVITVVGVDLGFMAGEETTMLEIIKGKRAMPQQRPPYPTQFGLRDRPTAILNIETVANLPAIAARGGDAFRSVGLSDNPGTKLFTVIGAGQTEGRLVEVPFGTTIARALSQASVDASSNTARGIVVGGLEGGVLPLDHLNTPLTFEQLEKVGTILGASLIEVLSANTCMVRWSAERMRTLSVESCGKCVPCRVGVKRMAGTLEGVMSDLGTPADLELLKEFSQYVPDGSLCGFGVHAVHPVVTAMQYFAGDFQTHLEGKCPTGTCLPVRAHRYATKHVL
jgi:NADH-quinone oxidoreductase subunit F